MQVHANAHGHIWSRSRRSRRFVKIGRGTENRRPVPPPSTRRDGMHEPHRFMRPYSNTRGKWYVCRCMQTRMVTFGRVQDGRGDLSKSAGAQKIGCLTHHWPARWHARTTSAQVLIFEYTLPKACIEVPVKAHIHIRPHSTARQEIAKLGRGP